MPSSRLVLVPFSDRLSDYDQNRDGQIAYEEFVLAVLHSVRLADVTEIRAPFQASDLNGVTYVKYHILLNTNINLNGNSLFNCNVKTNY